MEKELELLEELLTERETLLKIGEGRLSEDSLKKTAEEIESLCRIARIVRKEECTDRRKQEDTGVTRGTDPE